MKKFIILFCTLFLGIPTFAAEMKLLAKFPNAGFYYYYSPDFNVENYSKPVEITKSEDGNYTIFIYNREIPSDKFLYYDNEDNEKIEDDYSQLFSFILNGINAKPSYYIYRSPDYDDSEIERYICKFESNNLQVKYIYHPDLKRYIKQLEFNNGELGLASICNPEYKPGYDI